MSPVVAVGASKALRGRLRARLAGVVGQVTGRALGPYQSAVVRIGFAATWLLFLLREFPHRRELYGPDGPWSFELAQRLVAGNDAFTVLLWSDSTLWFELVYAVAVLSSALLLVGWRTRATSALFMVGVLSIQNRSVFMGDGGDNVVHLVALYLVLTRCAQVWSLDARRAARSGAAPDRDRVGPVLWVLLGGVLFGAAAAGRLGLGWLAVLGLLWAVQGLWWAVDRGNRYDADVDADARGGARGEARALFDVFGNIVHNAGLLVIMAEVCLIYATAGWYKIQGSRWQDGTALYYPLHLDYFSPWPELSGLLGASGTVVLLLSYGTVVVQVAFPFTLSNRRVKNVLLVAMMLEHVGIAVLMGLPFFSMAMIAADAVFLPTAFLLWLGARASGVWARRPAPRLPGRGPRAAAPHPGAAPVAPATPADSAAAAHLPAPGGPPVGPADPEPGADAAPVAAG
ncbi:HTTM domain-containing protein [Streptomyces sp. NPDC093225]|uniref:HTTM domain-containing protein n=1 Tax=Streptomyces sp. NPDC093225 TaxID=3366034 RepID=UPI0038301216